MANNFVFNDSLPVAPLKIAALESCKELAGMVKSYTLRHSVDEAPVLELELLPGTDLAEVKAILGNPLVNISVPAVLEETTEDPAKSNT